MPTCIHCNYCQVLRLDYLFDVMLRKQHEVERSDSRDDPGLGPGNQVTKGHEHGMRKHVKL